MSSILDDFDSGGINSVYNPNRRREYKSGWTTHYCSYRASSVKRGYPFELTKERFRFLCSRPCRYCGISPKSLRIGVIANGIDRVDSKFGYIEGNCVPCCKDCNLAKHDKSVPDFIIWLRRISAFQKI